MLRYMSKDAGYQRPDHRDAKLALRNHHTCCRISHVSVILQQQLHEEQFGLEDEINTPDEGMIRRPRFTRMFNGQAIASLPESEYYLRYLP